MTAEGPQDFSELGPESSRLADVINIALNLPVARELATAQLGEEAEPLDIEMRTDHIRQAAARKLGAWTSTLEGETATTGIVSDVTLELPALTQAEEAAAVARKERLKGEG
jgi:hypothetical protein